MCHLQMTKLITLKLLTKGGLYWKVFKFYGKNVRRSTGTGNQWYNDITEITEITALNPKPSILNCLFLIFQKWQLELSESLQWMVHS